MNENNGDTRPNKDTSVQTGIMVSGIGLVKNPHEIDMPKQIGNYRILDLQGRGGMGLVYKGIQTKTDRMVAVKVISPSIMMELNDDEKQLMQQRFLSEAKNAALIDHPKVVKVFEAGEDNGIAYLAMQLIDGNSLSAKIEGSGVLDSGAAAQLFANVVDGLHAVHEQQLIHRDISPRNIFIDQSGNAFLGDFGLAKSLDSNTRHTANHSLLGTLHYMAPELIVSSQNYGVASDVYAIGASLYQSLCGRPPFVASTEANLIRQIESTEPNAPSTLSPTIDPDLSAICMKCLEKSPKNRYQNAENLADDLNRYIDGVPTIARPISKIGTFKKWAIRNPITSSLTSIVVALTLALFLGSIFGWMYSAS